MGKNSTIIAIDNEILKCEKNIRRYRYEINVLKKKYDLETTRKHGMPAKLSYLYFKESFEKQNLVNVQAKARRK